MDQAFTPDRAETEYRRTRERPAPRPDRFALWAVIMAVVAMIAGVATADASNGGGIGTGGGGGGGGGGGDTAREGKYASIWDGYSAKNRRWARHTSECESGGNPKAIGGGGMYRGAFQFMRQTWRSSPKSPGGDPIRYKWKTQAVVAVELKQRDGAGHWPVCG